MAEKSLKSVKTRIVCVKSEKKQTTESGIFIASGVDDTEAQWTKVTFVGPDVKSDIEVGDEVVPMWNTVGVVRHMGETFYVVDEANIVAILK